MKIKFSEVYATARRRRVLLASPLLEPGYLLSANTPLHTEGSATVLAYLHVVRASDRPVEMSYPSAVNPVLRAEVTDVPYTGRAWLVDPGAMEGPLNRLVRDTRRAVAWDARRPHQGSPLLRSLAQAPTQGIGNLRPWDLWRCRTEAQMSGFRAVAVFGMRRKHSTGLRSWLLCQKDGQLHVDMRVQGDLERGAEVAPQSLHEYGEFPDACGEFFAEVLGEIDPVDQDHEVMRMREAA